MMSSVAAMPVSLQPAATPPMAARPRCTKHPHQEADWRCPRCQVSHCTGCMEVKIVGSAEFLLCPQCHGQCESLAPPPPPKDFYAKLPGAFVYPLKGWAISVVLTGAIMLFFTELAARFSLRAWLVAILVMGYMCAYLIKIANKSGDGDDILPHWPSMSDGLVGNFFLFFFTVLVSFVPVMAYGAAVIWLEAPLRFIVLPIYLSCLLLPMALLRVAMFQTLSALNPWGIVQSIFRVPTPYMVACILLGCLIYARIVLGVAFLFVPYVGGFLETLFAFYLVIVEMRILGLIYWAYQDRLHWFGDI
jgi:hypothetical protein